MPPRRPFRSEVDQASDPEQDEVAHSAALSATDADDEGDGLSPDDDGDEIATVASGRTVKVDGVSHGPGKILTLPAADVRFLRKIGALVTPGTPEAPKAFGLETDGRVKLS